MSFEARVATTGTVASRDEFGRFRGLLEEAGAATINELADITMNRAMAFAPKGKKRDKRTRRIIDSFVKLVGLNSYKIINTARHALPQETGSRPHPITGRVRFWWEREGRIWVPGDNEIQHPGNPGTRYMQRAHEYAMNRWPAIAKKHYSR